MSTYAVGDVQGCLTELERLLDHVGFSVDHDRLWLTGDLVNRGPQSLATLRFVRALGDKAVTVLGNHDLHLLAVALAPNGKLRPKDTFDDVLAAPDRDELLDWLRRQPLVHQSADRRWLLVHAGLPPGWSPDTGIAAAHDVEAILSGEKAPEFLQEMYGDGERSAPANSDPAAAARFTVNALTRMRYVDADGALDFKAKGPLGTQPPGLMPWFDHPGFYNRTASTPVRIVFGHWSTLELEESKRAALAIYPLDTGAVWGRTMTALRLEDGRRFTVESTVDGAPDD